MRGRRRCYSRLRTLPELADVNSDQQEPRPRRPRSRSIARPPRASASRRSRSTTRSTMPSASGQVSTMYTQLNQYHVVMEATPRSGRIRTRLQRHLRAFADGRAGAAQRLHPLRAADAPSPSTTRASSRPSPSRSIWRPAWRWAMRSTRSTDARAGDRACRQTSAAASRAPRRPFRPRWQASRC